MIVSYESHVHTLCRYEYECLFQYTAYHVRQYRFRVDSDFDSYRPTSTTRIKTTRTPPFAHGVIHGAQIDSLTGIMRRTLLGQCAAFLS